MKVKCPKCGQELEEDYDGFWCTNNCYDSSYAIFSALEDLEKKAMSEEIIGV